MGEAKRRVMYEQKRHDHTKASEPVQDADYYEIPEEFSVYEWTPAPPGTSGAKSTQVHLHFGKPPGRVMVVRFKGPDGLDALIEALQRHREGVWGKPEEPCLTQTT